MCGCVCISGNLKPMRFYLLRGKEKPIVIWHPTTSFTQHHLRPRMKYTGCPLENAMCTPCYNPTVLGMATHLYIYPTRHSNDNELFRLTPGGFMPRNIATPGKMKISVDRERGLGSHVFIFRRYYSQSYIYGGPRVTYEDVVSCHAQLYDCGTRAFALRYILVVSI